MNAISSIGDDTLSGKTFELSYPPVEEENLDSPSKYTPIVTLEFSKDNTVNDPVNDIKGTYKLNEDSLEVNFEDEDEKLTVNFNDLKKVIKISVCTAQLLKAQN